ncbi:ion transporter [Akkermansiaceae bacterium]|nr:ion transporter [Akkermansiaceae bacterium]MDA7629987.1 ion transporter [Akkermansiaceae bacterium]MDA7876685.1 ion transporter [Akkermansiaceae bacterium]MDA7931698.1 ion transporter [Akkermansiaceae bacterium]MDA8968953.1 ion transporter [Akkermansiaceae bacterium]
MESPEQEKSLRERLWAIVFEAETPLGKLFDLVLLVAILLSVLAVMLESVSSIAAEWGALLGAAEWFFTGLFTLEYLLRIALVRRPLRYMRSFYGVVDLLSCLPLYLTFFFPGAHSLLVIRILRLLRVFRILKMMSHVRGAETIMRGLIASRAKITVFFISVLLIAVLAGTLMYVVENGEQDTQFTSIPMSIYYAVVSITTVGFGDMVAVTVLGKLITTILVLSGYAIIAVPTGIAITGLMKYQQGDQTTDACPGCGVHGHLPDAKFCRRCGEKLD